MCVVSGVPLSLLPALFITRSSEGRYVLAYVAVTAPNDLNNSTRIVYLNFNFPELLLH